MKLFKNVGVEDLKAILTEGILPISKTGNDNWEEGLRGSNSTEVVYLHLPTGKKNTFTQYGIALVEVEIDDAKENQMSEIDGNIGKYTEFITDEVKPENITAVYIPEILKDRVSEDVKDVADRITWVKITAEMDPPSHKLGDGDFDTIPVDDETLDLFVRTTGVHTDDMDYFTGEREDRTVFHLYDVRYEI